MADEKMTKEPHDRLTRVAAIGWDAIKASPEWNEETDKLFISIGDGTRDGSFTHGSKSPRELVVDLLAHIRALSRVTAKLN